MSYIYDILINFNENLYEFYDWNLNDDISHIRKIPVFKVGSEILWDIKNNDVVFEKDFLKQIENKTEVFTSKSIKSLRYACLLCDGMETIGIQVDKKVKKSKLLIDEEQEVIEVCSNMKNCHINYKMIREHIINFYQTRKEQEVEQFVKKEIKSLLKEKDINKLSYLYYECFNEKETKIDKIIKKFDFEIKNNFQILVKKLYQIFKLLRISQ